MLACNQSAILGVLWAVSVFGHKKKVRGGIDLHKGRDLYNHCVCVLLSPDKLALTKLCLESTMPTIA